MTLTPAERWTLEAFRSAAKQVREASIIAEARSIQIRAVPGDPGFVDILVGLLGNEPFRSLALAIRLAYQEREPANFYSVCNLLHQESRQEGRERVAALRAQYRQTLVDSANQVVASENGNRVVFSPQQVFEHWLYGVVFHQDEQRQPSVRLLASTGAGFMWSVQSTGLQLAGRILDLDDMVADLLGEVRLPRI